MFKLLSLIANCISMLAISSSSVIASQTPSNGKQVINVNPASDYYDFIYQRTISLGGSSDSENVRYVGTGWLFKHIDDPVSNYKYYMFTNWHVSDVMKKFIAFSYSPAQSNGASVSGTYQPLLTNPEWYNANYYNKNNKNLGVDVALLAVDFESYANVNVTLKTRLDNLNTYASTNTLNPGLLFPDVVKLNDISQGKFYIGGYPKSDWNENEYTLPQWETGTDDINSIYVDNFKNMSINHKIANNINSISNAYVTRKYSHSNSSSDPLFKIGGGGSGSMIIDPNFNLLGLYWGGWNFETDDNYQCAFEPFAWEDSSGNHNLFNDYTNDAWKSVTVNSKVNYLLIATIILGIACVACITSSIIVAKHKSGSKKLDSDSAAIIY
ncbi:MAG: hypothetical protein Ta2E_02580 [Mycoplasmoidaceae bacterium]|nr:MAG: hypothetical protein Ta2E_02580 [Mycoplasmoidaceae bacterium]